MLSFQSPHKERTALWKGSESLIWDFGSQFEGSLSLTSLWETSYANKAGQNGIFIRNQFLHEYILVSDKLKGEVSFKRLVIIMGKTNPFIDFSFKIIFTITICLQNTWI